MQNVNYVAAWLKMKLRLVTFKDVFVSVMLWKLQSTDSQVIDCVCAAVLEMPVAFVCQAVSLLHVISSQTWLWQRLHAVHEELWEIQQAASPNPNPQTSSL